MLCCYANKLHLYRQKAFFMIDIFSIVAFDWDAGNLEKCQKHGVSLLEIESLFEAKPLYIVPDEKHSDIETRMIAAGRTQAGKPLFVAFTMRETVQGGCIRPISARYMHQKEAERYEQQESTRDEDR
jgi:uncharacterized protein